MSIYDTIPLRHGGNDNNLIISLSSRLAHSYYPYEFIPISQTVYFLFGVRSIAGEYSFAGEIISNRRVAYRYYNTC